LRVCATKQNKLLRTELVYNLFSFSNLAVFTVNLSLAQTSINLWILEATCCEEDIDEPLSYNSALVVQLV